jgi:hypothetical protein
LLKWPTRTKTLWQSPNSSGYWLQAQPVSGNTACPRIFTPGADGFSTQPDGLWVYFSDTDFCDIVAVESSATIQNLNDKRSRYALLSHSVLLNCPADWFEELITVPKGGKRPRWEAARTMRSRPSSDLKLPIRSLSVLYSLPNDLYYSWCGSSVLARHECICPHSSLDSYNSPKMQEFLKGMSIYRHYYSLPKQLNS